MNITESDIPLVAATLRHELTPSAATKHALALAIKEHSFAETREQESGAGVGEQAIPPADLAPLDTATREII
jgi:hypothetical protein